MLNSNKSADIRRIFVKQVWDRQKLELVVHSLPGLFTGRKRRR
jgi:hypothetical protein